MQLHNNAQSPMHERRNQILEILAESRQPVIGADLSERLGVSRQVIVQDMAILRAEGHEVLATPRGYLLNNIDAPMGQRAVLAVQHDASRTEEELCVMVDHGLYVIDVIVEHPIYGEMRGNLMLRTRVDVGRFISQMNKHEAPLLSALTDGVHMHTVEYNDPAVLEMALDELSRRGMLITY